MIFYHGTNEEAWGLIQKEGILWGTLYPSEKNNTHRYTYLTPSKEIALKFSDGVVLEVEYSPKGSANISTELIEDNYVFECPPDIKYEEGMFCWQFAVFVPIDLKYVKRII